jgi:hypothetical protein
MKETINTNHPRIQIRTPEHQEYRDQLAKELYIKRAKGNIGKLLAVDFLDKEKQTVPYIIHTYGYTLQAVEKLPADYVMDNLEDFSWIDQKDIARALIKKVKHIYDTNHVLQNLEKFPNVPHKDIVDILIQENKGKEFRRCVKKLQGIENKHARIADFMIETWHGKDVIEVLEIFTQLDHQGVAERLIQKWYCWDVACNLKKFQGLDHQKIASLLMEKLAWRCLAYHLENFEWLDHQKIADFLLKTHEDEAFLKNAHKFKGLNQETAERLIRNGGWKTVVDYLNNFQWIYKEKIATVLLEKWSWYDSYVAWVDYNKIIKELIKKHPRNIVDFEHLDRILHQKMDKEISRILFIHWYWKFVADNFELFEWLDQEIAKLLILNGRGNVVVDNLHDFQWLDKEICKLLFEAGYASHKTLFDNLDLFQWLDKEIILFLSKEKDDREKRGHKYVTCRLELYQGLDQEVADMLIKVWKAELVEENLDKFQG